MYTLKDKYTCQQKLHKAYIVNLWISVFKKQNIYVRIKKMEYTEHKQTMSFLKKTTSQPLFKNQWHWHICFRYRGSIHNQKKSHQKKYFLPVWHNLLFTEERRDTDSDAESWPTTAQRADNKNYPQKRESDNVEKTFQELLQLCTLLQLPCSGSKDSQDVPERQRTHKRRKQFSLINQQWHREVIFLQQPTAGEDRTGGEMHCNAAQHQKLLGLPPGWQRRSSVQGHWGFLTWALKRVILRGSLWPEAGTRQGRTPGRVSAAQHMSPD